MSNKITEEDYTRKLGKYLGFPDCCVDEFTTEDFVQGRRKLCGTGYVPCKTCNEGKTEQELVEVINHNRFCPDEFPNWKSKKTFKGNYDFVMELVL